jgi:signal transduction histidine kinase
VKIRHQIVLPFALLFAVVIIASASIAMTFMARQLDQRLEREMADAADLLSSEEFALNRAVLGKVKSLLDAEILTFEREGNVLVATFDTQSDPSFTRKIRNIDTLELMEGTGKDSISRDLRHEGTPYRVLYRRLDRMADAIIALVLSTADIQAAKRSIALAVGGLSVCVFLLLTLMSYGLAGTITRPIEALARHTRELSAGRLNQEAPASKIDELTDLACAFNDMAVRLTDAEQKLVHTEKMAIAGQLAARVAHDVRNPLSSVKMHAQLLRSRARSDEKALASIKTILLQTDQVERVIRELLDLSRPAPLHLQPQALNDVVAETLVLMDAHLKHWGIRVRRQFAADLPTIALDGERLKQALLNVLNNAVEAMPDGGELIVITRLTDTRDALVVEVIDEGEGIPPEIMANLFSPFFTTKRDGVGLGLVNARSILELHRGTLILEPNPGAGTKVSLTLPLTPADSQHESSSGRGVD